MRRNSLRSYQSVIILKPDLEDSQVDQSIAKIEQFFQKSGGNTLKLEKWGKKRLAYKVRKNKFGFYLNIYHTCANDKVSSLEREYQLFNQIIKYLIIKIEDKDMDRIMKEAESAEAAEAADDSDGQKSSNEVKSDLDKED